MTPEQKQQLEQIRERQVRRYRSDDATANSDTADREDIDFLLSLVKRLEAPRDKDDDLARFVLRCIRGCATDDQYIETLERVKTAFVSVRDGAATSMRSRCVEKVRAMGRQWYADAKKRGSAFSDKGRLAETIATELEKIIPQEQETPCADCAEAARFAYSDATTPGFFNPKCVRHQEPKQT